MMDVISAALWVLFILAGVARLISWLMNVAFSAADNPAEDLSSRIDANGNTIKSSDN